MPAEREGQHTEGGSHPHGRYGQGSVDSHRSIWHDGWDYGSALPTQYNPLLGNTGLNAYPMPSAMQVLGYGAPAYEWPILPNWGMSRRIATPWRHGTASFGWIRSMGGHLSRHR